MRKLTVGVLALGCLALLVGTIAMSLPQSVRADDTTYAACFAAQDGLGFCKGDKVLICHFSEGHRTAGLAHCQEPGGGPGGYESHVGPLGHGEKDYCVLSEDQKVACEEEPK